MMPGNVFGRWVADATALATEPVAGPVTGGPGRRVDLGRVLTGLRHLPAAAEPARVFTDLAAVCVPALCAEGVIGSVGTGIGSGDLSRATPRRPPTARPTRLRPATPG